MVAVSHPCRSCGTEVPADRAITVPTGVYCRGCFKDGYAPGRGRVEP